MNISGGAGCGAGPNSGCAARPQDIREFFHLTLPSQSSLPFLLTNESEGFVEEAVVPAVVPEPTTLLLFGSTIAGLGLRCWRQNRRKRDKRDTQEGQG